MTTLGDNLNTLERYWQTDSMWQSNQMVHEDGSPVTIHEKAQTMRTMENYCREKRTQFAALTALTAVAAAFGAILAITGATATGGLLMLLLAVVPTAIAARDLLHITMAFDKIVNVTDQCATQFERGGAQSTWYTQRSEWSEGFASARRLGASTWFLPNIMQGSRTPTVRRLVAASQSA